MCRDAPPQDPSRFPAAAPGLAYPGRRPPAAAALCGCLPEAVPAADATATYIACTGAGIELPQAPPCATVPRPYPRFLGSGPGQGGLAVLGVGDAVLNRDVTVDCQAGLPAAGSKSLPDAVVRAGWRGFRQVRGPARLASCETCGEGHSGSGG
jgi:hypothetical protein